MKFIKIQIKSQVFFQ